MEVLLAAGVEVDGIGRTEGKTALHLAAQYGHRIVAKHLLDHGANIEIHSEASGAGTDMMIRRGAGRTPLLWAAAGDDTGGRQDDITNDSLQNEGIVRLLLDRGADATARSNSYRTALHE